jgi:predicted transcriptional regulator
MSEVVSSLMQRHVRTIDMDDTVPEVEGMFARERLSWAPVTNDDGEVVGVISATDLLRFHASGKDAAPTMAWQLCTYKPITVASDATLEEVARLMIARGIHHVVVKDAEKIAGVLPSLDFVRTFISD